MAKKGEKQSPEYIAKRMASWKETRRKKGLPVSDDLVVAPFCACGCGQKVHKHPEKARWYKYINGHNRRGHINGENQRKAASLARKGITPVISEEVERERRRKISAAFKGRTYSDEYKKRISETLKRKYKEDEQFKAQRIMIVNKINKRKRENPITSSTREKMSVSQKKRIAREKESGVLFERTAKTRGENHPFWRGGVSFLPYPIEFNFELKHKVKRRDNYTCKECNSKVKNRHLHVHHIDYNKMNNSEDNLITLCNNCHAKTIGKRDRNFYKMYYSYKIKKDTDYLICKFDQLNYI